MKKFLSMIVAGVLALSSMSFTVLADEEVAVALPTATVTELEAPADTPLTFALNFTADEPTDEQLKAYGDWRVDYKLTVNKDVVFNAENEAADGYLAGQYDEYGENWIKVPSFGLGDVTLLAGQSIYIMDYAAKALNQSGLKLTYNDVYGFVKDFNCGVYFDEEFLSKNSDLVVTLELHMWDPEVENKAYTIGDPYVFTTEEPKGEAPSGTVTEITKQGTTFAMQFEADELTQEQVDEYGTWEADFELVFNQNVTLNANTGNYICVTENRVEKKAPYKDVTIPAGKAIKVRKFVNDNQEISTMALADNDFDFGVVFTDDFLASNPDLTADAKLIFYNPANPTQNYEVDKTYTFKNTEFKANSISVEYRDVTEFEAEGYKLYDIVLKSGDDNKIHEFASADLTFDFVGDTNYVYAPLTYEVTANSELFTLSQTGKVGEEDRYMFSCKGVNDKYEVSGTEIKLGQIKVAGDGEFSLKTATATTNIVNATKLHDNIVDTFVVGGGTDGKTGELKINEDTDSTDDLEGEITSETISHVQRTLTINVEFPNSIEANVAEYQDMTVTMAGSDDTETINLADFTSADGKGYTIVRDLDKYFKYTVTVEGAGYRTVSYTVTMDDNKTLNFWNNVKDKAEPVEEKKTTGFVNTTFLAGDIVKDANINIYDLSAVVAYFGTTTDRAAASALAKYDLNRDGEIDSKDVAYVLVSWNK